MALALVIGFIVVQAGALCALCMWREGCLPFQGGDLRQFWL